MDRSHHFRYCERHNANICADETQNMCIFNNKFLLLKYLANKEQSLLLSHIQVAILTCAGTHPYIEIVAPISESYRKLDTNSMCPFISYTSHAK
jgi:hypothetical protein